MTHAPLNLGLLRVNRGNNRKKSKSGSKRMRNICTEPIRIEKQKNQEERYRTNTNTNNSCANKRNNRKPNLPNFLFTSRTMNYSTSRPTTSSLISATSATASSSSSNSSGCSSSSSSGSNDGSMEYSRRNIEDCKISICTGNNGDDDEIAANDDDGDKKSMEGKRNGIKDSEDEETEVVSYHHQRQHINFKTSPRRLHHDGAVMYSSQHSNDVCGSMEDRNYKDKCAHMKDGCEETTIVADKIDCNSKGNQQEKLDLTSTNMIYFTSRLGRRVWKEFVIQHEQQPMRNIVHTDKIQTHGEHLSTTVCSFTLPPKALSYSESTSSKQSPNKYRHDLPLDFLRITPALGKINRPNRCSPQKQEDPTFMQSDIHADIQQLERDVLQCHLDYSQQATDAFNVAESSQFFEKRNCKNNIHATTVSSFPFSSLFYSDCFSLVIHRRDPMIGLGMSLRGYDGCVFVQAVFRRDGSQIYNFDLQANRHELDVKNDVNYRHYDDEEDIIGNGNEDSDDCDDSKIGGPAYLAGLRPGDRLLGLNGRPFLKGQLVDTATKSQDKADIPSFSLPVEASSEEILNSACNAIVSAPLPLVIHVHRETDESAALTHRQRPQRISNRQSYEMDPTKIVPSATIVSLPNKHHKDSSNFKPKRRGPFIHPFAKVLSGRNLIQTGEEELTVTRQMKELCDRTRQWESKLSYRLRVADFQLRSHLDARDVEPSYYASFYAGNEDMPPFFDYKYSKNVRTYTPSTPMIQDWRASSNGGDEVLSMPVRQLTSSFSREAAILADLYAGLNGDDADVQNMILGVRGQTTKDWTRMNQIDDFSYPFSGKKSLEEYFDTTKRSDDIFVPLVGVRKAMCVRLVDSHVDRRNRTAFTIWCYDLESGMEWYAPVRYYEDFKDLRTAIIRLDKSIGEIPFPSMGWVGFSRVSKEANESASSKEARRNQLEYFLRKVFAGVYRGRLHPYLAEVAIHLQTFVGCDAVLAHENDNNSDLALNYQVVVNETSYGRRPPAAECEADNTARMHLKRSIQRYVYRIFLLPPVETLVSQFIESAKKTLSSERDLVSSTQKQSSRQFEADKNGCPHIEKIRDFIDQVQDLVFEGCLDDFLSISQRRDFAAMKNDRDSSILEDLFRDSVREQIELEVYIPLRSTISRFLIQSFFNQDVEMKHKMKALENKPQSYFRIKPENRSGSNWRSVSKILQDGVGRSTLPCVKLRAIVDAAKEISKLDSEERIASGERSFFDAPGAAKTLGADDFLPIFIFCFVQAKLERPCALCELLQIMCDPLKLNGETGYYLATFHAAITHINELDLTEAHDDLSIFLDTLPD